MVPFSYFLDYSESVAVNVYLLVDFNIVGDVGDAMKHVLVYSINGLDFYCACVVGINLNAAAACRKDGSVCVTLFSATWSLLFIWKGLYVALEGMFLLVERDFCQRVRSVGRCI